MPGNEAQKRQSRAATGDTGLPIAMSSITTSAIETPSRRSVERTCDDLAVLVLAVVALIAGLTFRDYGLGWDDYTHAEYADLLLRMYGSGFKDTGALSFANLYMYGGGFDMAAALLHKVIPLELFETRRLLGAVVGVIGLAVTWRLGRRVGGPLAGLAALLLLALCPTFYGHMFMNPKDAPFAVAMVILMLGLVRLAEQYPNPSPRTILIVGLGAGLSIGSRILGGLALVYALVGFIPLLLEDARTDREAGAKAHDQNSPGRGRWIFLGQTDQAQHQDHHRHGERRILRIHEHVPVEGRAQRQQQQRCKPGKRATDTPAEPPGDRKADDADDGAEQAAGFKQLEWDDLVQQCCGHVEAAAVHIEIGERQRAGILETGTVHPQQKVGIFGVGIIVPA